MISVCGRGCLLHWKCHLEQIQVVPKLRGISCVRREDLFIVRLASLVRFWLPGEQTLLE